MWSGQLSVSVRSLEYCAEQGRALTHAVTDRLAVAVTLALGPFRLEEPRPRCVPRRVRFKFLTLKETHGFLGVCLGLRYELSRLTISPHCPAMIVALRLSKAALEAAACNDLTVCCRATNGAA